MSCGCCCTKTLDFCKVDICDNQLDLDLYAQSEGTHLLITYFNYMRIVVSAYFTPGQRMIFPVENLNENFQFTAEVYDPSGNRVVVRKNAIDYDCIRFQTTLSLVYG